jgi:hypothetical protein
MSNTELNKKYRGWTNRLNGPNNWSCSIYFLVMRISLYPLMRAVPTIKIWWNKEIDVNAKRRNENNKYNQTGYWTSLISRKVCNKLI